MHSYFRFRNASLLVGLLIMADIQAQDLPKPVERAVAPGLSGVLDVALDAASKETGLAKSELEVLIAEAVVWPDGSMGCPMPDIVYTQATVAGYRVRVRAGDVLLNYHANSKGLVFLCPSVSVTDPVSREIR
jgi:hypothetical protein